ncbi:MAG: DUF1214 domain-containing protein [Victivallales bacterium]|nr:DUF1214 domain-containing protein [Victivallales bacterium]
MKGKIVVLSMLAGLVGLTGCVSALKATEEKDTGVGKNGVALPSSPSFVKGGAPVDMFNIVRAETAKYFAEETILSGGNRMRHERTGIDLKNQTVIRSNFDLVYSYGVYDVSGGLEVTLPEYDLYQIVQIFDENHVTLAVVYPGQTAKLTKADVTYGEHVYLFMRTQQRTPDKRGLEELNRRQDGVVIKAGSAKPYVSEVKYDPETFNKLRTHLIGPYGIKKAVIHKGFVDDLEDVVFPHYQMVNLGGWAGLPAKHAFYFVIVPGDAAAKEGKPSSMTFRPPPVQYGKNGYWSLTLYNQQGWVATERFNTNSRKAVPNKDGSYTLNFNGGPNAINNLEVVENWNGLFRCYLPDSVESILEFKETAIKNLPKGEK